LQGSLDTRAVDFEFQNSNVALDFDNSTAPFFIERELMRHVFLLVLAIVGLTSADLHAGLVTSGLAEWYEAGVGVLNSSNTAATSGQGVQTWQNQSAGGSTYNVGQSTAANQPIYNPTGLNGHPALIFTDNRAGAYSVLDNLSVNAVGDNSSRTVFVVAQEADSTGGTLFTSRTTGDPANVLQRFSAGPNYIYSDGVSQNITAATAPGSGAFISAYVENLTSGAAPTGNTVGSIATQLNGVSDVLTGASNVKSESSGTTGFSIGDRLDNAGPATLGQGWTGAIAEVLVYDRALTPFEINQTGFYLAEKYGLTTSYVAPEPSAAVLFFVASAAGLAVIGRRRRAAAKMPCA
jgi:hypothetical protein